MELTYSIIQNKLGPQYAQYTLDSPADTFPVNYSLTDYAYDMAIYGLRYNQPDIVYQALPHLTMPLGSKWRPLITLGIISNNTEVMQAVQQRFNVVVSGAEDIGQYYINDHTVYGLANAETRAWLAPLLPNYMQSYLAGDIVHNTRNMRPVIQADDLELYLSAPRGTYKHDNYPFKPYAFLVSDYLYAKQFGAARILAHLQSQLPWDTVPLDEWLLLWYHISQPHEFNLMDSILDPVMVCPVMRALLVPEARTQYMTKMLQPYPIIKVSDISYIINQWMLWYYALYAHEASLKDAKSAALSVHDIYSTQDRKHFDFVYHTSCDVKYIQDPQLRRFLAIVFNSFSFKLRKAGHMLLFYVYYAYITNTVPTVPLRVKDMRGKMADWVNVTRITEYYQIHGASGTLSRYKIRTDREVVYLPHSTYKTVTYYVSEDDDEAGVKYSAVQTPYYIMKANSTYYISTNTDELVLAATDFAAPGWLASAIKA